MQTITTLSIALVCFAAALSVGSAMPQASVVAQDVQDVQEADQDYAFEQAPQLKQIPLEFQRKKRYLCGVPPPSGWGSYCDFICKFDPSFTGGYCQSETGVCFCTS